MAKLVASLADLRSALVWHFTHIDNLSAIVGEGALLCDRKARASALTIEVGDTSIKESRRRRVVPVAPGGTVGDYVPFYFAQRSPMMFRIACDCRDRIEGRYQDGDRPLVYLTVRMSAILDSGRPWVATDGNARTTISRFSTDPRELVDMIDWPLMEAKMWRATEEDPDRERRRAAELLVRDRVPLAMIHGAAAYSEDYAARVRAALGDHPLAARVIVRPDWYYGYGRR
jgi:ssDNA thymidine ADP-ribosyltransferase DarT-like protein